MLNDHVNIDTGTTHALQNILFEVSREWRRLLKLQHFLLLRRMFRKPWVFKYVAKIWS
jgi:hypothetical protein